MLPNSAATSLKIIRGATLSHFRTYMANGAIVRCLVAVDPSSFSSSSALQHRASNKCTHVTEPEQNSSHVIALKKINELSRVRHQQQKVNDVFTSIQSNLQMLKIDNSNDYKQVESTLAASTVSDMNNGLIGYQALNRNARRPKRANHGKRPCSRVGRRARRSKNGNPRR
mmetsp:Transcript_33297/g.38778  ORF Transcript_33297/g.38778 Transcript_33297/m.38778 type:complete len:170 (-) Transcript_33297:263-772(-)